MLIYGETEPSSGPIRVDPTRAYLRHYENYMFLSFIAQKSDDPQERGQARRELDICERKMKFHERTYNKQEALRGIQEIKRKWS